MTDVQRKLIGWFRRRSIEADLREEMRTHLEMKAEETGDLHATRRAFGNTTLLVEDSRAAWGWPQLEGWVRDLRYGFRRMSRRAGFAATVVLTLALGIGASSTVFSLIDTVLLRPLPYPNPDRLVAISERKLSDDLARTPVAPGRLEDWQRRTTAFEALAGSRAENLTDTAGPEPERISGAFVSPRFFTVLGTPAQLGRTFQEDEERFGGPAVAVIGDGFWRRRYGADPAAVGRSLVVLGGRFTIVGVMPPAFQHPSPATDVWIPDRASPALLKLREVRFYQTIGRLKAGIGVAQGQADLSAVQRTLGEQYPKTDAGWSVAARPLKEELTGSVRLALWLLLGSVGLLLFIACANVACLLLAQLNARGAEIATRLALGAGRGAITRQLLAEGLVHALAGGLLGLGAASAAINLLRKRLTGIPRISELSVDMRLLGFVLAVSVVTALLFSLLPVVQVFRRNLARPASRGGRGISGASQRLPRLLVAAQLTLATVLLVGAGLFLRSLMKLQETPFGFRPDNVLALRVTATISEPPSSAMPRHQRALNALAALPGVTSVAMSSGLPGVNTTWPREFQIAGEPSPDGALQFAGWRIVTAGYFQTLGISILTGQTCRMTTDPNEAFEVLVNRSFGDRYLKGRDPIGRIVFGGPIGNNMPRIVGVVADVKEDGAGKDTPPVIYACGHLRFWPDSDILVRTAGDPAGMANAVRQAIRAIEPSRPVYAVRPLTEAMDGTLVHYRFRTVLVSLFSAMALTLAAIGLYGLMAYMVTQRTKEIGLRVALGARPGQIMSEILRSGGKLTIAGAIAGSVLAALASRVVGTLLYGIHSFDTATYLAAASVLIAVA
ncbi:MAG: ADOP family duplicated permease, partial [Bryobacteraceae bacterium]